MPSKYKRSKDPVVLDYKKKDLHLACCDCGLVHIFNFNFRKNKLCITIKRDNRATGQLRRHRNIIVERESNA